MPIIPIYACGNKPSLSAGFEPVGQNYRTFLHLKCSHGIDEQNLPLTTNFLQFPFFLIWLPFRGFANAFLRHWLPYPRLWLALSSVPFPRHFQRSPPPLAALSEALAGAFLRAFSTAFPKLFSAIGCLIRGFGRHSSCGCLKEKPNFNIYLETTGYLELSHTSTNEKVIFS